MSRSGYSDDYDELFPNACALYGKSLDLALGGKRGQAFLRELVEALDAMPEKRLIADVLIDEAPAFIPPNVVNGASVCAIGAVGVKRGVDMSGLDVEDAKTVAKTFGIAECMAREIAFQNDESGSFWGSGNETPESRWQRMRHWAVSQLKAAQ